MRTKWRKTLYWMGDAAEEEKTRRGKRTLGVLADEDTEHVYLTETGELDAESFLSLQAEAEQDIGRVDGKFDAGRHKDFWRNRQDGKPGYEQMVRFEFCGYEGAGAPSGY